MGKYNRVSWMDAADFDDTAGRLNRPAILWQPTADVLESEDGFILLVELPGMTLADVTVELKGNQLIVFGHKPEEKQRGPVRHHVVERPSGPFARAFTLGSGVRAEEIAATLKDGLLTITLKKAAPRRRSIPVG
ncbi:Hsp20/alpha crystallin family protein [Pseudodesulfovibrio sp.]|uniref:Hsp20/alpha crystallin family protein n=1 Tax=Pseudodesulfovibrio sp. TaxID=2035812 RepID=UPI0026251B8A|nr:Hsp20/alpha crystallin family protein [Pseudodesulfovibrio sp.]MDD3312249.1 Hsp20/alpha crystallin family protein [Pseudodesulfovibrio sp.]